MALLALDPLIDDVPAIKKAFKDCGQGGKIVLSKVRFSALPASLFLRLPCDQSIYRFTPCRVLPTPSTRSCEFPCRSQSSLLGTDLAFPHSSHRLMEGCEQCVVEFDGTLKQSANISQIRESWVALRRSPIAGLTFDASRPFASRSGVTDLLQFSKQVHQHSAKRSQGRLHSLARWLVFPQLFQASRPRSWFPSLGRFPTPSPAFPLAQAPASLTVKDKFGGTSTTTTATSTPEPFDARELAL